ncbi:hypothetical protein SNE40_014479 [Patella caerulea]|uniref:Uncharacterized protein n=1 Tax=Patella caerulea TaxID=87958 RepID=A0AAN8JFR3_PATCE
MIKTTSNLQFEAILDTEQHENWSPKEAVDKLEQMLPTLNKPILIFSQTSRSAAFVVLLYLAKRTKEDPNFEARINSARLFKITATMGMDFTSDYYKQIVSEVTGEPKLEKPPVPNIEPKSWIEYWLAHPVYKNWFTAGQITKPVFPSVESAGFPVVVNVRSGKTYNGNPNQEEVTLVNVRENTGTYGKEVKKLRQSKDRLEDTRIDPLKPKRYVSENSDRNYESRNENDFGDDIGYNEEKEREYFTEYGKLQYLHLPIVSAAPFTKDVYETYRDRLLELGSKGPVLVHCAKARRAGFLTILAAAQQHNKDLAWALRRSRELGYGVSEETNPVVYETFVGVLGTDCSDGDRD